jgi:hypothetical protein
MRPDAPLPAQPSGIGNQKQENDNDLDDHRHDQKFAAFVVFVDVDLFHDVFAFRQGTKPSAASRCRGLCRSCVSSFAAIPRMPVSMMPIL